MARTRAELADALARAGIQAAGLRLGYLLMHAEQVLVATAAERLGSFAGLPLRLC